jgi:hypothetical protein
MTLKKLRLVSLLGLSALAFACSKKQDAAPVPTPAPSPLLPIAVQFKFGPGASPITIDSTNKVLRNLPAGCNVQKLAAAAVLPSGFTISPDPSTVQDYTKGVNFTVAGSQGSYTIKLTALPYDSVGNPYGIYTVMDLSNVRHYLNGYFLLMNDIQLPSMSDPNAVSATGIADYSTNGWYCIGSQYVNGGNIIFRGSLDGQNHSITNLSIAYRSSSLSIPAGLDTVTHNGKGNDGLFGFAIGARFKNIGVQLAGGIVGMSTSEADGGVGALVGRADTCTFTNCNVTGSGSISGGSDVGGLIGRLHVGTITKCYAAITHAPGNFAIVNGGGLIGSVYLTSVTSCYSSCDVTGSYTLGGLIGSVSSTAVQSSYASGSVVEAPSNGGSLVPANSLGGLIGTVTSAAPYSTILNNCYAVGSVTGATSGSASYLASSYLGGLTGNINPSASKVTVTNCYAAGAITRTFNSVDATTPLTGGLVGNTFNGVFVPAGGSCSNYWDRQATLQTILGGGNASIAQDNGITANGMTTTQMKTQATYTGWDFTSTWSIDPSKNNGYPVLR